MSQRSNCKSVKLANESADHTLKSINSRTACNIRFENRTSRRSDLLWFDYDGCAVKYCTILPGRAVNMVTFVGHPWVCRDTDSGVQHLLNHTSVFKATDGNQDGRKITVMITIPVYTLHERCLEVLSCIVPREGVEKLDIPVTLKEDLMQRYKG